jgi:hypothetical protein
MERAKQQRIVDLDRGLFLVRYASAEDEVRPPKVKVSPEPASDRNVSLVLHPDQKEPVLWRPGACLVVRTATQSKILIEVTPARDGASVAATVRMEKLTPGDAPFSQSHTNDPVSSSFGLDDLRVLGHVASIGDVIVRANEWLAGPSAPSRIEGISIQWPGKPEDVDIGYSVKTARPQTVSGRTMDLGSFAGTRGKAMPVVGLTFELSGGAADLQFNVEAIFLGAPATRITGRRIALSGPTGREPLVGLRLGLEGIAATAQPTPSNSRVGRTPSGVRVFRGRPKQDQSMAI